MLDVANITNVMNRLRSLVIRKRFGQKMVFLYRSTRPSPLPPPPSPSRVPLPPPGACYCGFAHKIATLVLARVSSPPPPTQTCTPRPDHDQDDTDHLSMLPAVMMYCAQDLCSTDPTHETCGRSFTSSHAHPAAWFMGRTDCMDQLSVWPVRHVLDNL